MNNIKKLFKEHSIYILIVAFLETILSVICTISFVYTDTLSYENSIVFESLDIEKLLESIYSSTWWALILFLLFFIACMTITSIVYKKLDYFFISIIGWFEMLILAINLNDTLANLGTKLLLFIPIIIINIIAYREEKKKLNKKTNPIKEIEEKIENKIKKTTTKKNTKKTNKK